VFADDDVEAVGGDEVLCEIRLDAGHSRSHRRGNGGMRQVFGDQTLELGDQLMNAFGRQIEPEQLDRDELVLLRIVSSKDRAERACPDLMKNAEGTERVGRRGASSFRVQCETLLLTWGAVGITITLNTRSSKHLHAASRTRGLARCRIL
jgi:hypothetical protein